MSILAEEPLAETAEPARSEGPLRAPDWALDQGLGPPLVSVIVTAYNCEHFIQKTLESVRNQTYGQFECIVVEDCATDATLSIVLAVLGEFGDPRFRMVRQDRNQGQLGSQILGFRVSLGEFVVFLDADDFLFANALESHLCFHLKGRPIVAMTCLDSAIINQDGALLSGHHRELNPRNTRWLLPAPEAGTLAILGVTTHYDLIPPAGCNAIDPYHEGAYWNTQSFMMFRRGALGLVLPDGSDKFRICADFYLVRFVHAFNATVFIHQLGGAYRVHGANHFATGTVMSSDQQPGDYHRFRENASDLTQVAAQVMEERFELFAANFGAFRTARAALSLPRAVRPATFKRLVDRAGLFSTLYLLSLARIGRLVWKARLKAIRISRLLWHGN